jgi:mannosyltransferase
MTTVSSDDGTTILPAVSGDDDEKTTALPTGIGMDGTAIIPVVSSTDGTTILPRIPGQELRRRDPWLLPWDDDASKPTGTPHQPAGILPWLIPAAVMAIIGSIGINRPGLWANELQTWGMVRMSFTNLKANLHTDGINGSYYVIMFFWRHLFGLSDVSLRFPSLIAMVVTAGLVGLIGSRLGSRPVGLVAGLMFCAIPATSRYAQEARVYAMVMMVAALATLLLLRALEKPVWARFALYALSTLVLGFLHVIALTLLIGHGWVVLAQHRRQTFKWASGAVISLLPAILLLPFWHAHQHEINANAKVTGQSLLHFPENLTGLAAIGVFLIVALLFSLPVRRPQAIYTAWAVVPTVLVLVVSVVEPVFLTRYLEFTLAAWVLAAATALCRSHRIWIAGLGVLVIAGIAIPTQLSIRDADGHGIDSRALAAQVESSAKKGDGIVYDTKDSTGSWVGRTIVDHYVPASKRPSDLLNASGTGNLIDVTQCADTATCIGNTNRLWIVRSGRLTNPLSGMPASQVSALSDSYTVQSTWHYSGLTLALLIKQ